MIYEILLDRINMLVIMLLRRIFNITGGRFENNRTGVFEKKTDSNQTYPYHRCDCQLLATVYFCRGSIDPL